MKKLSLIVLLLCGSYCLAQPAGTGLGSNSTATGRMEVYKWANRPDNDETDLQKRFIRQEWTAGNVKFRSGRADMQVQLLFDIHNDMLYYLQDSVIMEFVDSVSEVQFFTHFNEDTVVRVFRRFYPVIKSNTSATFYEVLVDGPVSLLKCQSKTVLLFKDPEIPEGKRTDHSHLYFASLPGGKLVPVAPDADLLARRLPEYRDALSTAIKKEKIKPKDEARLVQLFMYFNNAK